MKTLSNDTTSTRLQGIKMFLTDGITLGEFDANTTVAELLSIVEEMQKEKLKGYKAKLRNMQEDGTEDDNFR